MKDRETAPLVERVIRELTRRIPESRHTVCTVFFGGGTPTLLPADELAGLLRTVGKLVDVAALDEFTVEANPATVADEKAALLVAHGVTRVSMGAQSFFPEELAALERLHTPEDIAPSVATLRRNGIREINLDLIFGIPGQTLDTWGESLRRVLALGPDHVACYGLTFEPGTRLTAQRATGRVRPCDEELEAEMYLLALDTLTAAGYRQYETSNYARPGWESRHNLMYWRNRPYVAVGPSAVGCIGDRRYRNVPDIAAYVRLMDEQGHAEHEVEAVTPEMLMLELPMMQLRLVEGLNLEQFRELTGADGRALFADEIQRFTAGGLLTVDDARMALTRKGRLLSDAVLRELAGACGRRDVTLPVL